MEPDDVDTLLFTKNYANLQGHKDAYVDYCLEQYRIYLHVFNSTSDRSHKSNEFFLGLNAAIIGISISYSWYKIIRSYSQLNRAKFKILHALEERLPAALFKTEWHLLGEGKDKSKYYRFSKIEKNIPITFILLYIIILVVIVPWGNILGFLGF